MRVPNKSSQAPLGTVFFLFLGLAIVPLSLRVAGVPLTLSPRLAAAMDAWDQIAGALSPDSQKATVPQLADNSDPESQPENITENSLNQLACAREINEQKLSSTAAAPALKVDRRRCPWPKPVAKHTTSTARIALADAASAVEAAVEKSARALGSLSALKDQTLTRDELIKSINRHVVQRGFGQNGEIRTLITPETVRVLVRTKLSVGPSPSRRVECMVRAALASARGVAGEGAELSSPPITSSDLCEF